MVQIEAVRAERQKAQAREQVQPSKQPLSPLGQVISQDNSFLLLCSHRFLPHPAHLPYICVP